MSHGTSPRLTSVDALRGLTIAFMILVNDPGDWGHVYAPLDHAQWNGFTPTDLVFPMFLFLIGCSIVFSISSRLAKGVPCSSIALQILRRAAILFAIKMFLSAYPHFHLTHLRIYGVLTRIALCYLAAGLIFLYVRSWRALAALTSALLVGYWVLMRFVPVPGLGMPVRDFPILDPERNLAAWLDRGVSAFTLHWIHMGRLYQKTRDPEGLLSTLPAVATSLLGILAALWLRHTAARPPRPDRFGLPDRDVGRNGLLLAGIACIALGQIWNPWFPVNKNLWTSSYVLYAGGWSLFLLGLCFWFLDSVQVQRTSRAARLLLRPLLVFGSNAIVAFVFSEILVETLLWWKVGVAEDGNPLSAWAWLYLRLFARHGSTENTSLAFALAYVAVCLLPNWHLWRKRIFVRV